MSKLQYVKDELHAVGACLRSEGVYFRLIMSDDIDNMGNIRERAKAGLNHLNKVDRDAGFFYGITIRQNLQDRIDTLVRDYKPQLFEVIQGGEPNWEEFDVDVIQDPAQNAFLILFRHCCAGFYVSERVHTPREQRKQRTSMQDLKHKVLMTPVQATALDRPVPTGRRRKFTTIRHHVN